MRRPTRILRWMTRAAAGLAALLLAGPIAAETPPADAPLALEAGAGRMLQLERPATSIYVANPDVADVELKSPRLVYVYAKRPGETTLYAVGRDDRPVLDRRVLVEHALGRLRTLIDKVRPEAQIELASLNQSLVLTGTVESAEAAEDIRDLAARVVADPELVINRLRVAESQQVNLRVRIAEVSREVAKELGVSWDVLKSAGDLTLAVSTGSLLSGAGASGSAAGLLSFSNGNLDVNALIDALDDQELITVLAEPNLTALSGETANFLAGGEFPIPVPDEDGSVTIVFREFGVSLSFMPVVLNSGRLHIKVMSEVSQLSDAGSIQFSGFNIPALTTRKAETTVNLGSGQSFAIAGLLQNTTNQTVSRVAGLGDLPILGPLFRSNQFQREESELVVIVTPYVVRPTSGRLAAPTDGFVPASDGVRNLEGATHQQRLPSDPPGPVDHAGRTGGVGPAGFILR